jgi:hypothetical protein
MGKEREKGKTLISGKNILLEGSEAWPSPTSDRSSMEMKTL